MRAFGAASAGKVHVSAAKVSMVAKRELGSEDWVGVAVPRGTLRVPTTWKL